MRVKIVSSILVAYLSFCFFTLSFAGEWATSTVGTHAEVAPLYSSMAMDKNGKIHIAYYHLRSGTLKYATNASGLWQTTAIDDNGRTTSIAVDSNNNVHIVYYAKASESGLKYATNASGSWTVVTVDPDVDIDFVYVKSTAVAVDSAGKAHVCYYFATNTPLKYASNASGTWVSEVIDSDGCEGDIAVDSADNPHIVYSNKSGHLMYAKYSSDTWDISDSTLAGEEPSIIVGTDDTLHVSYISSGNLYYVKKSSETWNRIAVDNDLLSDSSIAIDSTGAAHICYYVDYPRSIKYATNASGEWLTKRVDPYDGLPAELTDHSFYYVGFAPISDGNSIAIGADDSAHITYSAWLDGSTPLLRYATNKAPLYDLSGEWRFSTTDNWSAWEPDDDDSGTLTIQQTGSYVTATNNAMAGSPVIFEGKAAGSIYELCAVFPEDDGTTVMMVSFMASSDSQGKGPQVWLYRDPPSYAYGGCSIEYRRSSFSNTGGSESSDGDGGGGCFIKSSDHRSSGK